MQVLPIEPSLTAKAPVSKDLGLRAEVELSLVPPTSAAERARQLMLQAKTVSLEHLEALCASLVQARDLSEAVVQGGDLYTAGLHDFAKRLAEELLWREKTLEALMERQRADARAKA